MCQRKIALIIGFSLLLIAGLLVGTSFVFTAEFVEDNWSPDGDLTNTTIHQINSLRMFALASGLAVVVLAGLAFAFARFPEQGMRLLAISASKLEWVQKGGRRFPLWLVPLFISLVSFINTDGIVRTDMAWYMNSALNLLNGYGYQDITHSLVTQRAPGFPFMIVLAYAVLGVSAYSAFWIVRLFAILAPVVIFLMGQRMFNRWIGLIASLLYVTSYSVNYWSYRHIDAVWPLFALLAILALVLAFERRSWIYAAISGATLGLAFLVKEIAILLVPMPLLAWLVLKQYRNKYNGRSIVIFGLSFVMIVAPLFGYVYAQTANIESLPLINKIHVAQTYFGNTASAEAGFDLMAGIGTFTYGLYQYIFDQTHTYSLINNFTLWPLFLIAWLYTLGRAFLRRRSETILLLAAALFSPLLAYFGMQDMRLGQGIFFFGLTYLATANFLYQLSHRLNSGLTQVRQDLPFASLLKRAIPIALVTVCISLQMFVPSPSNIAFLQRSGVVQWLSGQGGDFQLGGRYNDDAEQVGKWIKDNIPRSERILVSDLAEARPIYFYSKGNYTLHTMSYLTSDSLQEEPQQKRDQTVLLSSWFPDVDPRNKLIALQESQLFDNISKRDVSYILVSRQKNYLSIYFKENPGFELIKSFQDGKFKLFRVNHLTKIKKENFEVLVTARSVRYLNRLENQHPQRFQQIVDKFIVETLSWPSKRIRKVMSGNYGMRVQRWKTY